MVTSKEIEMVTPCPKCSSTKEPFAEIVSQDYGDAHHEYMVWVCPDCGYEEM
jgi:predicted nucleic-acid-binding Zn-ribbon protein